MSAWDPALDSECRSLVERTVAGDVAAWRALLVTIAPRIEQWARGNRMLRRCRLTGDDDARAVMVSVLERLAASDHANLRRFLAQQEPEATPDELATAVARLGKLSDDDDPDRDDSTATPLRGWLLRLVDYVARDHVRERFGWSTGDGGPTKRDLHSDAASLSEAPEAGVRPPMTDRITVATLVAEIEEHIATFPDDMRQALALWLDDVPPDDIATRLALGNGESARALVRAGQARLRARFRGRSPLMFA